MDKLLKDAELIKLLDKVDTELAGERYAKGCAYCFNKLHVGDYPRKPRGVEAWDKRYSFTCSKCRKRNTPPSVRYLGRRVYAGVVVILLSAMMHGPNTKGIGVLRDALGVDLRTLKRWRRWWLEVFVNTPFWKAGRGQFMPVVDELLMPHGLVGKFVADSREGLIKLMFFLAPITTLLTERTDAM